MVTERTDTLAESRTETLGESRSEVPAESRTEARAGTGPTAEASWRRIRALVVDRDERREVCEALDLSFIRVKALLALRQRPMTLRELASSLTTDRPYTTLTVDALEERGLVERTVHPRDRRARLVELTPDGYRAANRADEILSRPPAAFRRLTADDLAALDRITRLLVD